jgi:hypothetical protein
MEAEGVVNVAYYLGIDELVSIGAATANTNTDMGLIPMLASSRRIHVSIITAVLPLV